GQSAAVWRWRGVKRLSRLGRDEEVGGAGWVSAVAGAGAAAGAAASAGAAAGSAGGDEAGAGPVASQRLSADIPTKACMCAAVYRRATVPRSAPCNRGALRPDGGGGERHARRRRPADGGRC